MADLYGTNAGICPVHNGLTINTGCAGLPGINISPLQTALSPPFPSPVGSISNQWAGGFGSPTTIPTPVPMGSFFHTPVLPQSTLNHLINLQQQPLIMHQIGGGIMAPSIRSPDSSCNASTTGSSSSRTHMLGNFAKSSASVASDTKDNNGESLCAVNVKYNDVQFTLLGCILTTILISNTIERYGISDPKTECKNTKLMKSCGMKIDKKLS